MKILRKILVSFILWFSAALFFYLVRIYGNEELPPFNRTLDFDWLRFILEMAIFGLSVGIPFTFVDYVYEYPKVKKLSYWKIIGLQTILQVIIGLLSLIFLVVFIRGVFQELIGHEIFQNPWLLVKSKTGFLWLFYITAINLIIYVFKVVRAKIGNRVFTNLLLGKYHFPREESRIFMFLDMKDSTVYGEKLGHIKFSALIQDCFGDLTEAIKKHKAEVYQYVGDEAILTWKIKNGLQSLHCLSTYFSFMDTLQSRGEFYMSKYGFQPFFKAAVHIGPVTVAEVGIVKREIAYHSDVLNTTARIQSKCNELNASLLISQDLMKKLDQKWDYSIKPVGSLFLKGKSEPESLFKVNRKQIKWENSRIKNDS